MYWFLDSEVCFFQTHQNPENPRNLQQDPLFPDPEQTCVSNSSIATCFIGKVPPLDPKTMKNEGFTPPKYGL